PVYRDQPILADGRVRYEGEPVAAVAAVDRATALEAVQRIEVRYRRLPIAGTAEAALAPDAPVLHEQLRRGGHYRRVVTADPLPEKNVAALFNYRRGDVQS